MNLKKILFVVLSLLMVSVTESMAENTGGYFSFHLGATSLEDSTWTLAGLPTEEMTFNTGVSVATAGGYDWGFVRLEGELSYAYNEIDTYIEPGTYWNAIAGSTESITLMSNLYIDIENPSKITPYIMGGIGGSYVELKDVFLEEPGPSYSPWPYGYDDTTWAVQYGGGIDFFINDTASLGVSYRYFSLPELKFGPKDIDYDAHRIFIGVRATF